MKKKKGSASAIVLLFCGLLPILVLLGSFIVERFALNTTADIARDSIVFSNLACYKDIDKLALGDTPSKFKFSDPNAVINTFKTYLETNMRLDSNMSGVPGSIAVGQVIIKNYIIYNIDGNTAEIITYDYTTGSFTTTTNNDITANPAISPCGTTIKKTAIHTTIEFKMQPILQGLLGKTRIVDVMADTDITY